MGVLGGHKFKSMLKLSNGQTDLYHIWHTFIWEWIYAKQIAIRDTRHLGFLGGQTCKSLEKLSNGWTDSHQLWFTYADSSVNGYRLNTSRPTIPQGGIFGGFRGSPIQISGEAVKLLDRLASSLVYVWGFVWE